MPELPEVETTRRGIESWVVQQKIVQVVVREKRLRWPVPDNLSAHLTAATIEAVDRRAKYLLFKIEAGYFVVHLGMSGSLRIIEKTEADTLLQKHDHIDLILSNNKILRYNDPRRFGCVLWLGSKPYEHRLMSHLGVEPLDKGFDGSYLFQRTRKRKVTIKSFIMDAGIVVGVGNIYASEALFLSGVRPKRAAGSVSRKDCDNLVKNIKAVLKKSIKSGGTTLRDFVGGDGKPGYFKQRLFVYGRSGESCKVCQTTIKQVVIGQRSSFYCPNCQR